MMKQKLYAMVLALITLAGCSGDPEELDYGTLSQEDKDKVAYRDGGLYDFIKNDGRIIHYSCTRNASIETDYLPDYTIHYEQDLSLLIPDIEFLDIAVNIVKADTARVAYSAYIGTEAFLLPLNREEYIDYTYFDSLEIQGRWYADVYGMRALGLQSKPTDIAVPDSLFYCESFGIVRFTMDNGEFYDLHP